MGQDVDARSDIYSLGILTYEMLTGHPPFQAETLVGVAMKHVNEPMPDVQAARPQVSAALSAVIERATDKEPKRRYADMAAMLSDLEGALDVEVTRAGGATGEATTVIASVPEKRRLLPSRKVSVAGILLVLAVAVVALGIAALTGDDSKQGQSGASGAPASGAGIELVGSQDFDPEGDDAEHPEVVKQAIDGDPDTPWTTETYTTGPGLDASGKSGVGLILSAAEPVAAREMTISSSTGGWSAKIYGASEGPPDTLAGWGSPIGKVSDPATTEVVTLDATSESEFFLIWITDLADSEDGFVVEIGEVELTA